MLFLVVSECIYFLSLVVIAINTISAFLTLGLTSGSYRLSPLTVCMTLGRDFFVSCVVTSRTSLVCIPTMLGAGSCLCRMLYLVMSELFNRFGCKYLFTYGTLLVLASVLCAGCRLIYNPLAFGVSECRDYYRSEFVLFCIKVLVASGAMVMSESSFTFAGCRYFRNPFTVIVSKCRDIIIYIYIAAFTTSVSGKALLGTSRCRHNRCIRMC